MTSLSFVDAALGTKIPIKGLGGDSLVVTVPPGTQSGTSLRLHGRGMPRLQAKGKGDLFVIVEVRTPTDITSQQRTVLEEFARLEKSKVPQ
jgi:molecular chaperone DnaJ